VVKFDGTIKIFECRDVRLYALNVKNLEDILELQERLTEVDEKV